MHNEVLINFLLILLPIFAFPGVVQTPGGGRPGLDLQFIAAYDLSIPEPSGLSLDGDHKALWVVSDRTNRVYKVTLRGESLQELIGYRGNDLEGVVYDFTDSTLWVAEEQRRQIVQIDLHGREISRKSLDFPGSGNNGIEGICLDSSGIQYVINEKKPRQWVKLDRKFASQIQKEIGEARDLSGITCGPAENQFWIVSDKSHLLFLWDAELGLLDSFNLAFKKAEGVAYDPFLKRIYIVSDFTAKLYVYQLIESANRCE